MKQTVLFISLTLLFTATLQVTAQEDVAGSKDHPLLSRYDGSRIIRYSEKEFESFVYPTAAKLVDYDKLAQSKTVEGQLFLIEYVAPSGVTATQVFRTYQAKLGQAGFKQIFSCRNQECGSMPMHFVRSYLEGTSTQLGNTMVGEKGSFLVASGTYDQEQYIVSIAVGDDRRTNAARYVINVVKAEALDIDKVDVTSVTDKLKQEGKYAFYGILFDTNSATIKEESTEALQVIADYLKAHSTTSVLIVGHTDNTGDLSHNVDLSQKRAQSVVDKLTATYGIKTSQVTPVGVGMAAPVATNTTEEGRALNRRVELVLK